MLEIPYVTILYGGAQKKKFSHMNWPLVWVMMVYTELKRDRLSDRKVLKMRGNNVDGNDQ